MKQKFKLETKMNDYSLMAHKNKNLKASKLSNTKIFALYLILLSVVLSCLYITDIGNESLNTFKEDIYMSSDKIYKNCCSVLSDEFKFDCFPKGKADKESCEARNCCWSPSAPNSQIPWCYYPSNHSNYKVINITQFRNGIIAFYNLTSNTSYKNDIKVLCMDISFQTSQRLHIKVGNQ